MSYKHELTARFMDLMEEAKDVFESRRAGGAYRNMMFSWAAAFTEDRVKMFNEVAQQPTRNSINSGGAKITRHSSQGDGVVVKPCEDCPGSTQVIQKVKPRIFKMGEPEQPEPVEVASEPEQPEVDAPYFESPDDVMSAFEGDPDMMIKFSKKHSINIGRATKPETLAKKIFEHFA